MGRVAGEFHDFAGREEPEDGDSGDHADGDPGRDEGHRDGAHVEAQGGSLLGHAAGGRGPAAALDEGGEDHPGDGGEGADGSVESDGSGRDAADSDPVGRDGDERQSQEEGEVGPEDAVGDLVEVVDEVVVVDPVDADLDEAEEIDENKGKVEAEGGEAGYLFAGDMELEDHDSDDDGDDAVGEGFEAGGREAVCFFLGHGNG